MFIRSQTILEGEDLKILVVEDEKELLASIGEGLELDGYYVDLVDNGTQALEMAQLEQYDLILLDLNLPGIDGLDLLRTLRLEHSETKVLILSARASVSDRIVGLDAGADDYLIKPFAFGELEARIRTLLRREYTHGEACLIAGDLRFDTTARQVFVRDSQVNFTKKELAILEYLMRHAGAVVSSEELMAHAWDSNVDLFSNSVRVHIFSVRKKLREALGYDPISNKVGEGYCFKKDSDE